MHDFFGNVWLRALFDFSSNSQIYSSLRLMLHLENDKKLFKFFTTHCHMCSRVTSIVTIDHHITLSSLLWWGSLTKGCFEMMEHNWNGQVHNLNNLHVRDCATTCISILQFIAMSYFYFILLKILTKLFWNILKFKG